MAFTWRTPVASNFASTNDPVVTAPTGLTNGDFVFVAFVTNTNATPTAPSGWTLMTGDWADASTDASVIVMYKWASGEGASWTFTNVFAANEDGIAVAGAIAGGRALNTSSFSDALGNVTTRSGPSITPSVNGCMIVQVIGTDPASSGYAGTPDTSPLATERFDGTNAAVAYCFIQSYEQPTASAVSLDATGLTSDIYGAIAFALAPALTYTKQEIAIKPMTGGGASSKEEVAETFTKSGIAVKGFIAYAGSAILERTASGTYNREITKAEAAVSARTGSGADIVEFVETGTATKAMVASGPSEFSGGTPPTTHTKSGIAVKGDYNTAFDNRAGTAVKAMVASGTAERTVTAFEKTGLAAKPMEATGSQAREMPRANIAIAARVASGGWVGPDYVKTGSATLVWTGGGTPGSVYSKTGIAAKGSATPIYERANTAVKAMVASGSAGHIYSKQNTPEDTEILPFLEDYGPLKWRAFGTRVPDLQRQNTAITARTGSGADEFTAAETGTAATARAASGLSESTIEKSGTAAKPMVASGTSALEGGGKTGNAARPMVAAGFWNASWAQAGTAEVDRTVEGFSQLGGGETTVKAGIAVMPMAASGTDVTEYHRANTAEKTFTTSGSNDFVYIRLGTGIKTFTAGGEDGGTRNRFGTATKVMAASGLRRRAGPRELSPLGDPATLVLAPKGATDALVLTPVGPVSPGLD